MHPALSVIFFTTASGAGYGMLALLGLLGPAGVLPGDRWLGLLGFGLAFTAVVFGLLSSTLHLGRPERAWRALSQWRSSWLSREGVAAVLSFGPAGIFALGWVLFGETEGFWGAMGVATAAMAGITVFCTAMIYRSLKTIHQWHNGFVAPVYLLLGLMTGALWLTAIVDLLGLNHPTLSSIAVAAVVLGWIAKAAYWRFIDSSRAISTPATATGLRGGTIRVLDWPHTQENYLLQEMGFKVARKHAERLRRIAHLLGFALPLMLSLIAANTGGAVAATMAVLAALSTSIGILAERWLFFAEAKHTVTLYYGAQAA